MISPCEKMSFSTLKTFRYTIGDILAKQKYDRNIIQNAIEKSLYKKEVSQITIKIDAKIDNALIQLSQKLNISKNRLIENVLYESGLIEEVEENYID